MEELADAVSVVGGEVVIARDAAKRVSERLASERDPARLRASVEEVIAQVVSLRRRLPDASEGVALELLAIVSPALRRLEGARDRLEAAVGFTRVTGHERAAKLGEPSIEGRRLLDVRADRAAGGRDSRARKRRGRTR